MDEIKKISDVKEGDPIWIYENDSIVYKSFVNNIEYDTVKGVEYKILCFKLDGQNFETGINKDSDNMCINFYLNNSNRDCKVYWDYDTIYNKIHAKYYLAKIELDKIKKFKPRKDKIKKFLDNERI